MERGEQLSFLNDKAQTEDGPVVCLGMTFKNDEERREYFRNELRKKLPELKKIEGFPIGEDEDIIALSDPPYYTACPNPWINDFIDEWEREKVEKYGRDPNEEYHRLPFSSDVTEGKNDAIYNAHSYHTKTPYKAIMRYILNYTNPGDIIFDGFAGTGMTGVASQLCNSKEELIELGYNINNEGFLSNHSDDGEELYSTEYNKIGNRHSILIDISPAATFIAHNYNTSVHPIAFERESSKLLSDIKGKFEWVYYTFRNDSGIEYYDLKDLIKNKNTIEEIRGIFEKYKNDMGLINYIVWSEVYICSNCSQEITYYNAALDENTKKLETIFYCPYCHAEISKNKLDYSFEMKYDHLLGKTIKQAKRVPVLINYSVNNKRYQKVPDILDLKLIEILDNFKNPFNVPKNRMMYGNETRRNDPSGHTHVHHFYTSRTLLLLGYFISNNQKQNLQNLFLHGSVLPKLTKFNRYMPQHGSRALVGPMANTLYLPPVSVENNVISQLEFQQKKIIKAFTTYSGNLISTQSSSNTIIKENSIDYVFLDPPFGANIMYSELNFIRESWLKIITNNEQEAIENKTIGKTLADYQRLITNCFKEVYRILKPGRWVTIEFSNTQAKIWNVIQHSLQEVGFVVASVDALNKTRGGLHSMIGATAVKQDLVISAYKPKRENIEKMKQQKNTEESAWTFVQQHLEQLPVFLGTKGEAQIITERTTRILFDRMVAYHVQNGLPVPISSADFQAGIAQRFPMRDGMVFLESQVAEYDKKRTLVKEFAQLSLFVSDESSAIEWLRQQLLKKPQTRQDLHPQFMKEIQLIAKHELLPELDDLLYQNFLRYEGDGPVPDQITSYLRKNYKDLRGLDAEDAKMIEKAMNRWYVPDPNKQADLVKLREKSLLREFEGYVEEIENSKKKLKQFRTEAIRSGFKKAWSEKDYEKIVKVGERLPESIIQEDDKLLMYYDNAQIRLGL